ncbi:hypothetical protein BE11_28965 [Sorangium cellulosum]|nr:hypothetical protein BE11_28965 [Sorangium cellulosum]
MSELIESAPLMACLSDRERLLRSMLRRATGQCALVFVELLVTVSDWSTRTSSPSSTQLGGA